MENREAIKYLKWMRDTFYSDKSHKAFDMAIAALEQQEQEKWVPVTERLPEECEEVNITWVNTCPEPYYRDIKDKPFTGSGL